MTPALSPDVQAQLAQLRDIRLPDPVGWWPLAPGWWLLLVLACTAILSVMLWNSLRKRRARYLALRELETLDDSDPVQFATSLSVLLRRVALRKDRRIGQAKGADWVAFLTGKGMEPALAEHLAIAPYAGRFDTAPEPGALRRAVAKWIRSQT